MDRSPPAVITVGRLHPPPVPHLVIPRHEAITRPSPYLDDVATDGRTCLHRLPGCVMVGEETAIVGDGCVAGAGAVVVAGG